MLYYLTTVLYVLVCLVLMLVILLQQGKGGDIASAFGGGGSQTAFGARSGATVLSRATAIGAVLFIVGALVLGILGQRGPGSVVGGRAQPGALPAAATLPAAPAPKPAARPGTGATRTRAASTSAVAVSYVEAGLQTRLPSSRKWRNWQTHQLEGLAVAIPWGFESPLPHQPSLSIAGEGCPP